jgi:hypothetical protein
MRNERIVDSWGKIEPDGIAEAHMLKSILDRAYLDRAHLDRAHLGGAKNGNVVKGKRSKRRLGRRWTVALAACLVLVVALTVAIGSNANWFKGEIHTVELSDGAPLDFYQAEVGTGSLDFGIDVTSRDLTADENAALLGDSSTTACGIFSAVDGSLLRVEGHIGTTRFVLAAFGVPVSDTIIDADKKVSTVNGVPVSAGYFITAKNSTGMRNIIYFASFTLDDVAVYIEQGGLETESEALRGEITSAIEWLIQNGTPDFARVSA